MSDYLELVNKNSDQYNLDDSLADGWYEKPIKHIKEFDNAEDHFRDLLENASDIIYQTDLKGNFIYVNQVAARITEYSVEQLLQMNYLDIIASENKKKTRQFYSEQLSEEVEATYFEFLMVTKSGKKRWLAQNARIIKKDHKLAGLQAVARDITDKNSAEKELRATRQQLQLFVKHAPVSVAMFDTEMRYIMASSRWKKDYNIEKEKLNGVSHYELFPELSEEWVEYFSIGLSGVTQSNSEDRLVGQDGTVKWVKWEILPWKKPDGSVGGITVYTEDITDRKKNEADLLQAREDAQQASAAKSSFIASMSHEFRTPLNSVLGFAEILNHSENLSDEQQQLLTQIYESGNQLLSMINDVIEISRIETSRIDYEEVDFAIEGLLQSSVKPYLKAFNEKGIGVKAQIDSNVPRYIASDLEICEEILQQLCSNALKFTNTGNITISVHYKEWDADSSAKTGQLKIAVADTGIGFDNKETDRIFRPFAKLNNHDFSGTGLGLTVVQRLCRFLGGKLQAESEEGKGSIFTVYIPVKMLIESDKKVEEITFSNSSHQQRISISAKKLAVIINELDSEKKKSILQALEFQELEKLAEICKSINTDSASLATALNRLQKSAESFDFKFLKEVQHLMSNQST